ncbi:hypothetical protein, partial [Staphylococcus epidermidis]|uniref:hypothetical protein n=1 Tax=Staphylococcus epidermidis TaxID=1282 RepID=UPI001C92CF72
LRRENNEVEEDLEMLNGRDEGMKEMVRNDRGILFGGVRCGLKDRKIELRGEIKYEGMGEVGIDGDRVDEGGLRDGYEGDV